MIREGRRERIKKNYKQMKRRLVVVAVAGVVARNKPNKRTIK